MSKGAEILSNFSDNQRYAVEQIQQSLVLTAGAGAGKTRVLVHRYLQLLSNGYGLDQIVAITFTNKAAGEMRERIGEELLKRLQATSETKELEQLKHWILMLPTATITTIHGFCSSILRQFPLEAQVDPHFQIMEEWESRSLLREVVVSSLESALDQGEPIASILLHKKSVNQAVETLQNFLQQINNKGVTLTQIAAELSQVAQNTDHLWQEWEQATQRFCDMTLAFKQGTKATNHWQELLKKLPKSNQAWFKSLSAEAQETWLQDVGTICQEYEPKADASFTKNGQFLSDAITACRLGELLNLLWEDWLQLYYPSALSLLQMAHDRFTQEKRKQHCLDFADLEHLTLTLLRENPHVVQQLRKRYHAFLVDEFQDTNYAQFELISLLNQNTLQQSLFVAGDVKQSIYGFRGAVVALFKKMSDDIGKALSGTTFAPQKNLETNYRSGAQIIQLVNDYFQSKLADYEPMLASRPADLNIPQLELLVTLEASGELFRNFEAEAIAKRIQEMIKNQETLVSEQDAKGGEQPRPVRYGDIAMLFRSRSDLPIYEGALKILGIPYLVVGNRAFYQRQEIQNLLHGLAAVANANDDYANWAWFTAAYHGIPLKALAEHVLQCRNRKLNWLQYAWLGPKEAEERWQPALHKLQQWQKLRAFLDVPNLLRQMIQDIHLETYYSAQPMGEQAWTNLSKFISLAEQGSGQSYYGIHECLYYFHQLAEEESEAELTLFTDGQDAVRLMTIHAAKGLEFPVLFLPDLIRKQDHPNSDYLGWNAEHGFAFRSGNKRGNQLANTLLEAEREESQRILYVAMTRAKDYLILCGGNHKRFNSGSWWSQIQEWLREDSAYDLAVTARVSPTMIHVHGMPFRLTLQATQAPELPLNPPNWEIPEEQPAEAETTTLLMPPLPGKNMVLTTTPMQEGIPVQARPAARVSATGLLNFRRCPRSYYLRYRLWLREDPFEIGVSHLPLDSDRGEEEGNFHPDEENKSSYQDPLLFGSMVHRICELATLETNLEEVLEQVLAEPVFHDMPEHGDEALKLVKELMENSEYRDVLKKANQVRREWNFLAPIVPGIYLDGVVDLLTEDAQGNLHILDYKTNQVPEDPKLAKNKIAELSESYRLQLQWYAIAVEQLLEKPVASAQLALVRANHKNGNISVMSEISCLPSALEQAKIEAQNLAMQMETGKCLSDYIKNVNPHCKHCPYMSICLEENERRILFENHIST